MVTALQMITKPMAVSKPHLSWSQLLVTASNAGHAESATHPPTRRYRCFGAPGGRPNIPRRAWETNGLGCTVESLTTMVVPDHEVIGCDLNICSSIFLCFLPEPGICSPLRESWDRRSVVPSRSGSSPRNNSFGHRQTAGRDMQSERTVSGTKSLIPYNDNDHGFMEKNTSVAWTKSRKTPGRKRRQRHPSDDGPRALG